MSSPTHTIDASHLRASLASDDAAPRVIDVRTPAEFHAGHIPGAVNVPLDQLCAHAGRLARDVRHDVVLVCQSGVRATQAHDTLTAAGLDRTGVLEGGMNRWSAAGAPTDAAADTTHGWDIERQVRLVAGGIVAGSIAASTQWPRARYLAGAIGVGLTYAALSNTCAMARVLLRMPWNTASDTDVDAAVDQLTA